jgi:aminopeptidase-like protein
MTKIINNEDLVMSTEQDVFLSCLVDQTGKRSIRTREAKTSASKIAEELELRENYGNMSDSCRNQFINCRDVTLN